MARSDPRLRTSDGKLNSVGARAFVRRTELRLTQDALCARLALATKGAWNISRREIYHIENGDRIVSDLEVLALAEALECEPIWLMQG